MATQKQKSNPLRPVVVKYVDWGDFIQMDKRQWKRVERLLGRLGVYVEELSRVTNKPKGAA